MSATEAMVVPSLKLLASMTLFPFLMGTSSTIPDTVAFTRVLDALPPPRAVTPSCTMRRLSSAA